MKHWNGNKYPWLVRNHHLLREIQINRETIITTEDYVHSFSMIYKYFNRWWFRLLYRIIILLVWQYNTTYQIVKTFLILIIFMGGQLGHCIYLPTIFLKFLHGTISMHYLKFLLQFLMLKSEIVRGFRCTLWNIVSRNIHISRISFNIYSFNIASLFPSSFLLAHQTP